MCSATIWLFFSCNLAEGGTVSSERAAFTTLSRLLSLSNRTTNLLQNRVLDLAASRMLFQSIPILVRKICVHFQSRLILTHPVKSRSIGWSFLPVQPNSHAVILFQFVWITHAWGRQIRVSKQWKCQCADNFWIIGSHCGGAAAGGGGLPTLLLQVCCTVWLKQMSDIKTADRTGGGTWRRLWRCWSQRWEEARYLLGETKTSEAELHEDEAEEMENCNMIVGKSPKIREVYAKSHYLGFEKKCHDWQITRQFRGGGLPCSEALTTAIFMRFLEQLCKAFSPDRRKTTPPQFTSYLRIQPHNIDLRHCKAWSLSG